MSELLDDVDKITKYILKKHKNKPLKTIVQLAVLGGMQYGSDFAKKIINELSKEVK